ncbi:FMN-dependent alpha-hydroxy acid dehydrogenase, active site protein [Metarhizium robertsii ARSEF 23]|uniref:FMN-dependent alpha-hydroxy acid dehydrogenase, active site protein n=1 Tax=Metarhizium robertsii (strain ARSEF 23 / ATCC MYA-3075) TaxID=655844 RepID=A0A0B2XIN3_METRA|nr:FMN-dependent alpha-hydroxy acid dehydrogenase, active site protein [Metarhizium robertsii ARSEF 23]KHO11789.1 FMN-dependent alpha-hydroxy acid dehydrogenase, active site protein [Metarhizium robertsii ARSEF 23]
MEAQITKTESIDGPGHVISPQTQLVVQAFKDLEQKAEAAHGLEMLTTSKRLVTIFLLKLRGHNLEFLQSLADLTDNNCRYVETVGEALLESVVKRRCGSEYGRYCDLLCRTLKELKTMEKFLGFTRYGPEDISLIFSRHKQLKKLLQSLCTLGGVAGAALQISFARIQENLDELVEIRRLSQKDPSAQFFTALGTLRKCAASAADILGKQNGITCRCSRSHQVYFRIEDCPSLNQSEDDSNPWCLACSLLVHTPSSLIKQKERVGMTFTNIAVSLVTDPHALKQGKTENSILPTVMEKVEEGGRSSCINSQEDESNNSSADMPATASDSLCATLNEALRPQEQHAADIVIYRQDLGLHLLGQPEIGWANPLPIRRWAENFPRRELLTEQKLHIAYKVAFSLLYLSSTPWIRESWTWQDIYLTWHENFDDVIYPVFSGDMSTSKPLAADNPQTHGPATHRIPSVTILGRFLVELWCGTSWKQLEKAFLAGVESSDTADPDTFIFSQLINWVRNSRIADRDKPFYQEGTSYFMAVENCFQCDFNPGPLNGLPLLESNGFACWIYKHVLRPLEYALEDFRRRQDRLLGARLNLNPEINSPDDGEPDRRLRLFVNERIPADRSMKEDLADDWICRYSKVKELARKLGRNRPDDPSDRVRVAILDTGVDVTHDNLYGPWTKGQIFYQNFVGMPSNIPEDSDGHGTHITSILLQMAENVDIYVARVSPDGQHWKSREVEDAIRWAADEKQVHIISLSFGFPNVDQSLEGIRKAILDAHAADVLVFAATGNKSHSDYIAFPACLDEVISVASTDGDGALSNFVPELRVGKRLCAIGEAIEAAWINKDNPTLHVHCKTERQYGTSYATPVVAGVAAMVMDLLWSIKDKRKCEFRTLRTNSGILAVLQHMMCYNDKDHINYLKPWKFFDCTSKSLESESGMDVVSVNSHF